MTIVHTFRNAVQVGLPVALCAILGGTGCNVLKRLGKTEKHGAIAFDGKGGWGYSFDQPSEDAAKKAATQKCPTCTVRLAWTKGCGALAQSTTKPEVMSAMTGFNRPAAESAARADCASKGGEKCKVAVWACNSDR